MAEAIRARGGAHLLALKANRPITHAEVAAFFANPPPGMVETHQTTNGDHGRIKVRRHAVCHWPDWLVSARRSPDEPAFLALAMIGLVESETERGGRIERERRYYLGSAPLNVETFARAVRARWEIENRLHWTLDVVVRDDPARLRTGHGPENMAVVRHMALNLLNQAGPTIRLKHRRKLTGGNLDYLNKLLRGMA